MKLSIFFSIAFILLSSCSHDPYKEFSKIQIGQDKGDLLETLGSPLRARHTEDTDIWTYRFYKNGESIYKDITLRNNHIVQITDAREPDLKAISQKEKEIEEKLQKTTPSPYLEKSKPIKKKYIDDSELPKKQKAPDDFKEVIPSNDD